MGDFGKQLEIWLTFRKIQVTAFAKTLKISRNTVYGWIQDGRTPTLRLKQAVLKALNLADEQFEVGPEYSAAIPWPQRTLNFTPKKVIQGDRIAAAEVESHIRIDEHLGRYLRTLSRMVDFVPQRAWSVREAFGVDPAVLAEITGSISLRHCMELVTRLNISPVDLPLRGDACSEIEGILGRVGWKPVKGGNYFSYVAELFEDSIGMDQYIVNERRRKRHAKKSVQWVMEQALKKRGELAEKMLEIQSQFEAAINSRQEGNALVYHAAFHCAAYEECEEREDYKQCLLKVLSTPTRMAIDDPGMAAISRDQHRDFIHLLKDRNLQEREVNSWYQREHAFGRSAALLRIAPELRLASG